MITLKFSSELWIKNDKTKLLNLRYNNGATILNLMFNQDNYFLYGKTLAFKDITKYDI